MKIGIETNEVRTKADQDVAAANRKVWQMDSMYGRICSGGSRDF